MRDVRTVALEAAFVGFQVFLFGVGEFGKRVRRGCSSGFVARSCLRQQGGGGGASIKLDLAMSPHAMQVLPDHGLFELAIIHNALGFIRVSEKMESRA